MRNRGDRFEELKILKTRVSLLSSMGVVRLRIKEFADKEGWTIKELSQRSGVPYSTIKTYARLPERATVDLTALKKLAQTFNVLLEDLFEVVEE